MLSSRYAIPTIILLLLALIPTIIHSYIGALYKDGKTVHNIEPVLEQFTSAPSQRNERWGKDVYGSDDWFERIYRNGQGDTIRLFVARSYDQKRLYHHPELALSYSQNLNNKRITTLTGYPDIPVHLLSNDDHSRVVAYILMYNNKFIRNPVSHQFRDSIKLLISARKPMTLFYAAQSGPPSDTPFSQSALDSLLSLAIHSFQTQTPAI